MHLNTDMDQVEPSKRILMVIEKGANNSRLLVS